MELERNRDQTSHQQRESMRVNNSDESLGRSPTLITAQERALKFTLSEGLAGIQEREIKSKPNELLEKENNSMYNRSFWLYLAVTHL